MVKYNTPKKKKASFDIDKALSSMNAEDLRDLVRDLLLELDDRAHGRILNSLMERAARSDTKWSPEGPKEESIAKILSSIEEATEEGYADPEDVDDYFREGSNAFLSKDYHGASKILRALLLPISEGEIDLGQHEMIDEVLTVDVAACATQYVVATYMITAPEHRATTFKKTILEVYYEGHFWHPLEVIEQASIEPLPDFDRFLGDWRKLLEEDIRQGLSYQNDDQNRWLREVVRRMEGANGLAKVARASRRSDDLGAWCRMLVDSGDWKSAFAAYKEAADIVIDSEHVRGDFLDGVALAAQELGKKNLAEHLERAWRQSPSLLRLVRWLGTSKSKLILTKRAKQALDKCPKGAIRQKAFLHFLLSDFGASGTLLGNAKGLGWSNSEHTGHLLFPLFYKQLGGKSTVFESGYKSISTEELRLDEMETYFSERDEPKLNTPTIDEIASMANLLGNHDEPSRKTMLKAMKAAAKKRVEGVTGKGRRKYYGHAAQLVAACAAVDSSPETTRWVEGIRSDYRRYPALQAELNRVLR